MFVVRLPIASRTRRRRAIDSRISIFRAKDFRERCLARGRLHDDSPNRLRNRRWIESSWKNVGRKIQKFTDEEIRFAKSASYVVILRLFEPRSG